MKPFSWSYSLLSAFEQCPKRAWHTRIAKDVREEESESLSWGNEVHKALHERVGRGKPLPLGVRHLEAVCTALERAPGKIYTEQKMAITADFKPCDWFAKTTWCRTIIDFGAHDGSSMFIADYKTGKIKDDDGQLALCAGVIMAHMPEVATVRSAFIWLRDGAVSHKTYTRAELPALWNSLLPRVERLQRAYKLTEFETRPGGLCRRYCPVRSCPHYGG